jgi:hypothetical protein
MRAEMVTLLLRSGCHYVTATDADYIARSVKAGVKNVEITSYVSALVSWPMRQHEPAEDI